MQSVQEDDHLQRFTEAHGVGQQTARLLDDDDLPEELDTFDLVRLEVGVPDRVQVDRLLLLRRVDADMGWGRGSCLAALVSIGGHILVIRWTLSGGMLVVV